MHLSYIADTEIMGVRYLRLLYIAGVRTTHRSYALTVPKSLLTTLTTDPHNLPL